MLEPPEAIDYVVVHELAHIRYKNHGEEFYRFVASVLPDWRERERLLR
jgi:predicted metal-dependent hydrolase